MKRFKLSGNTANWNNGLRMSALNIATLTEEASTPIPSDSRMFVSVANNIFHVNDTRREIISGVISEEDKNAILSRIKGDTPDFLLTLEGNVVGYACLHYRKDGKRVCNPYDYLNDSYAETLARAEDSLSRGIISQEEFDAEKKEILSDFADTLVKSAYGTIMVVANVTPATPKHSFRKDGLTEEQRNEVYDEVYAFLHNNIFDDGEMAVECTDAMIDEIVEDIQETADWEDYEDDEYNSYDVHSAIIRVMHKFITR
jgi:hypothetical protein